MINLSNFIIVKFYQSLNLILKISLISYNHKLFLIEDTLSKQARHSLNSLTAKACCAKQIIGSTPAYNLHRQNMRVDSIHKLELACCRLQVAMKQVLSAQQDLAALLHRNCI